MRSQAVAAALLTVGLAGSVTATPAGATVPGAVAVPAVSTAASVLGAPVQEDGLDTRSSSTFVVDPAAGGVRVTVETTVTNQIPNRTTGGVIEQAYFSEIGVPILAEATTFAARKSDGTPLTVTPQGIDNPYVKSALIDLEPNLFYGQSQTITFTYNLPRQAPRAAGVSRVNDAFVGFPAFTFGDVNATSVEIRLPERYEVEIVGADMDQTTADGQTILTAENIENPDTFMAFVVGTDDDKLVSKTTDADGTELEVRAWPDDAEWADATAEQVADAKPVLEELIGQPWPREDELVIVETAGPYAYGYAGWYSEADHTISIGDELDSRVMVHELSHVWFNSQLFADRWVAEGFAEEYAAAALEELDQPQDPAAVPDPQGPGAVALNAWSDPFLLDETSDATEKYGYATSWYVIDQIAQEVGVEKLQAVMAAAADNEIAYRGDQDTESDSGVTDWRRLLDLLEERGGSAEAAGLWDAYVVTDEQRPELVARGDARTRYAALVEQGDGWTAPLEVRRVMGEWRFDTLDASLAEAEEVLDLRTDIEAALDGHGVDRLALEAAYESATDTADVVTVAEDTLAAAEAYARADDQTDEGAGILGSVGLLWSGTDDRLDTARRELESGDPAASLRASRTVQSRLDDAGRNGALRVGAVVLVLVLALVVTWRVRRWRRGRRARRAARSADAADKTFASLRPLSSMPDTPPGGNPESRKRGILPPLSSLSRPASWSTSDALAKTDPMAVDTAEPAPTATATPDGPDEPGEPRRKTRPLSSRVTKSSWRRRSADADPDEVTPADS